MGEFRLFYFRKIIHYFLKHQRGLGKRIRWRGKQQVHLVHKYIYIYLLCSDGKRIITIITYKTSINAILVSTFNGCRLIPGAIPPLGAFFGSLISGALMQRAGRKRTLQLTAPLWVASWIILGFAKYFPLVLLGRAFSGVCVGFVLATAQVYVRMIYIISLPRDPLKERISIGKV